MGPLTGHQKEEISVCPSAFSFSKAVDYDEITPRPSFSELNSTSAPSAAPHKCSSQGVSPSWSLSSGHSLMSLWTSFIVVPRTVQSTRGEATPAQSRVDNHHLQPAGHEVLDAPPDTLGPFGCKDTLLIQIQLAMD